MNEATSTSSHPTRRQRATFWLVALATSLPLAGVVALLYAIAVSGGSASRAGYAWILAVPLSYMACILALVGLYAFVRESSQRMKAATIVLACIAALTAVILANES